MSQISGVRKLKHTNSFAGMLPKFGVECANEEELSKVRAQFENWEYAEIWEANFNCCFDYF